MLLQLQPEAPAAALNHLLQVLAFAGLEPAPVPMFAAPVWSLAPAPGDPNAAPDWRAAAQIASTHAAVAAVYSGDFELASRGLRPAGTRVRVAVPGGGDPGEPVPAQPTAARLLAGQTAPAQNGAGRVAYPRAAPAAAREASVEIGGGAFIVIAGPCSVESEEQIRATAAAAAAAGASLLRGGAFKPRTSTYSFQGLGRRGLELLAAAGRQAGLGVVTEVMAPEDVPLVAESADLLQVGARNMQNFPLLKRLGRQRKPVLLKRGAGASIAEWLAAAEYLLARGNDQVVLCERTFETYTRNTLDISAVAAVKELSHLPVLVDPSHATGRRSLIASASRAALAAGADGLCLEVHIRPEESVSDREQAISPEAFAALMSSLRPLAAACGRRL